MSWLNSLNNIKGQLTNLAQEVLAEVRDEEEEILNPVEALEVAKRANDELNALCVSKENEIATLRKCVTELQNKISEGGATGGGGGTSKSAVDKNASLEDSWCWESDQGPSDKTDNDQNSESSSGGEMVNIPLDAVQQIKTTTTGSAFEKISRDKDTTLKTMRRDKIALNEKIAQLQAENQQLSVNIEELDMQHNIAVNNVLGVKNDLQKKYNDVLKDYESLKKEHAAKFLTTDKELEIYKKKINGLQASYTEYAEENADLKVQADSLKELLVKKEQDIKELLARLQSEECVQLKEKIEELTKQLEGLQTARTEKKLSESSSGKQSSDDEFIVLQDDDSQGNSDRQFEDKVLELEGKLSLLEVDNSNCLKKIEELESLKAVEGEEKRKLNDLNERLQKELANLTKDNDVLQKEFEIFKNEFNLERFSELKEKNEQLQKYLNAESDKLIDHQSEHTIARNELEAKISNLESLLSNKTELEAAEKSLREEKNQLTKRISELEKALKETESLLEVSKQDLTNRTELEAVEKSSREEHAELTKRISELETSLKQAELLVEVSKNDELEVVEKSSPEERSELTKRIAELEKALREVESLSEVSNHDDLTKENSELKLKIAEINENATDVESKLMMENVDLQKKLHDLESCGTDEISLNTMQSLLLTYTETKLDGKESLETAFKSIRDKIWRIEVLEGNQKDMSEEIAKWQATKDSWEHEKKTLEADLGHYESEVNDLMKNNEILLNELENYKHNKLETISENNEENIVILETQLEECNNLNRTLEEEYRELHERIAELENENSELSTQLKSIQEANSASLRELQAQIETLEGEKSNLMFEINEIKSDDEDVDIDALKASKANLERQMDRINNDHADLVATMRTLNATLLESKKENEKLEREIASLTSEKLQLDEQLKTTVEALNLEKSELLKTLQSKHSENIQYYTEIQRLGQLLQTAEKCDKCAKFEISLEKLKDQISFLREKSDILTSNLMTEQTNQRVIQQEKDELSIQKQSIQKDLDRLREHLVELEESHTLEMLEMQNQMDEVNGQMSALQEDVSKSSNAYTSASIRANQHAETIQAQYTLVTQQRDELAAKLSQAEDRESKNQAALVNLQCALEQFQNDKESDIKSAIQKIRKELQTEKDKQRNLISEIAGLNQQLTEANQGLLAASRISDQLEISQMIIAGLKEEIEILQKAKHSAEEKLKASESSQTDKIEKSLVKSLVIGYVVSNNQNDKSQIMKLISSVLDFNQTEIDKIGLTKQQSGWFGSLVPVVPGTQTKDNLMQAFVHFLEQESEPRMNANMPNLLNITASSSSPSGTNATTPPRSAATGGERKVSNASGTANPVQPILLNENVLDHFAPTRNSSSILKDILSDS